MKIYTNVKVLKKAYVVLKELNLQKLLSGSTDVKLDIAELLDALLQQSKLNEFCQIITATDIDFQEMQLEDLMLVICDFFQKLGTGFKMFSEVLNPKVQIDNQQ